MHSGRKRQGLVALSLGNTVDEELLIAQKRASYGWHCRGEGSGALSPQGMPLESCARAEMHRAPVPRSRARWGAPGERPRGSCQTLRSSRAWYAPGLLDLPDLPASFPFAIPQYVFSLPPLFFCTAFVSPGLFPPSVSSLFLVPRRACKPFHPTVCLDR